MALLRNVRGQQEHLLEGNLTLIGRDTSCDLRLRDESASRRHAILLRTEAGHDIEDLGSVNGTWVNGRIIQGRAQLQPGDRLEMGSEVFTYQAGTAKVPPPCPHRPLPVSPEGIVSSLDLSSGVRVEVGAEAKLRAVLQISGHLAHALDLTQVLPKLLDSLLEAFPRADRALVLLRDPKTGRLTSRAVRNRGAVCEASWSRTIVRHAIESGQVVLSVDAEHDDRFGPSQSIASLGLHSVMCAPMRHSSGRSLGVLQIDACRAAVCFSEEDLGVLACASTLAARAVELAYLYEERRELEAATEIQRHFLPSQRPRFPGLSFFDHYLPAQQIGGDYYDYIPLPDNRLAVTLGDVAGKGVTAALLMARLSAAARFYLAGDPDLAGAVGRLNRDLMQSGGPDHFVTFVAVVLDLAGMTMTVLNAGHPPPLRRRADGTVEELGTETAGIPLGVFDRPHQTETAPLEQRDVVVLYTDGVTEAKNLRDELYGHDRLRTLLRVAPPSAEGVGRTIVDDVARFAQNRPAADDLALVCFGRT